MTNTAFRTPEQQNIEQMLADLRTNISNAKKEPGGPNSVTIALDIIEAILTLQYKPKTVVDAFHDNISRSLDEEKF